MIKGTEITPLILESLNKLSRFWLFSRKRLALEVRTQVEELQQQGEALHARLLAIQAVVAKQKQDIRDSEEKGQEALEERDQARALCTRLQDRQNEGAQRIGQLETQLSEQGRDLDSCRQTVAMLQEASEEWATAQASLYDDLEQITNQHLTLRQKSELVRNILSQPAPANSGLDAFGQLIKEDYLRFAAQESSLADEAGALMELQAIHRELELIVDFPSVRSKTLLAVAGGFSSGKSQFINSFISGGEVTLAVGLAPVTVVPSYVVCGEQSEVRGYAANGGALELSPEFYASLSHEYLESFGFDLRQIMPFISVQVPMQADLFKNLCLIDTPGYDPGRGKTISGDQSVAQDFIGQAAAMIWVIGLGTDGTISQSDLDFIETTALSGQSLYFLLNKADLKPASSIDDVIAQIELTLEINCIDFAGICAYSSKRRKVYATRGQTLEEFLQSHNQGHDVAIKLEAGIDQVFDRYNQAIVRDLERQTALRRNVGEFKLKTLEVGGTELYQATTELSDAILLDLDSNALSAMASECAKLRRRFKGAVRATLDEMTGAASAH